MERGNATTRYLAFRAAQAGVLNARNVLEHGVMGIPSPTSPAPVVDLAARRRRGG